MQFVGRLDAIHFAAGASAPMVAMTETMLVAGLGIAEDRYATRTGTYSDRHHIDRQITLIEAETLEALRRDRGIVVEPHEHRRNLTTSGVPMNHLVDRYFRVGEAVCYGGRLNVPCKYLEGLLGRPVFRPLINRSGLNGRVIVGGVIRVGDRIEPVERASLDAALVEANEANGLEPPPDVF